MPARTSRYLLILALLASGCRPIIGNLKTEAQTASGNTKTNIQPMYITGVTGGKTSEIDVNPPFKITININGESAAPFTTPILLDPEELSRFSEPYYLDGRVYIPQGSRTSFWFRSRYYGPENDYMGLRGKSIK